MMRRIIRRGEWGAKYADGFGRRPLPVPERHLHHSVTIAPDLVPPYDDDYAACRRLEEIGQARFGRGMSYSTLFMPSGLIFEGLGIDRVGSHTGGHNTAGVGLCLVGNYEDGRPTSEQETSLAWWLRHAHEQGWITGPTITHPHSATFETLCPGKHARARIESVNRLALGDDNLEGWSVEERAMLEKLLVKVEGIQNAVGLSEQQRDGDNAEDIAHAGTLLKRLSLRSRGMQTAAGMAEILSGGVHFGTMVYELWAASGLDGADLDKLAGNLRDRLGAERAAELARRLGGAK